MFSPDTVATTQAHLEAARRHLEGGQPAEGMVSLRAALALMPMLPEPHHHLANILRDQERPNEAIAEYRLAIRHAVEQKRRYPEPYLALGALLEQGGHSDEALETYMQLTRLMPSSPHFIGLGHALMRRGDLQAALTAMQKALTLDKATRVPRSEVAQILIQLGRPKAAAAFCAEALRADRNDADAHVMHAFALLAQGRWREGFIESRWRWRTSRFRPKLPQTGKPVWNGEDLDGKCILVHAEQGAGDVIQFSRYITRLAGSGARVVAAVPRSLHALIAEMPSVSGTYDSTGADWPIHDFIVPVMDLPGWLMRDDRDTLPNDPYLALPSGTPANPAGCFRVGIAWAANPGHILGRMRSILDDALAPLAGIAGVEYVSLQQDKALPKPFAPLIDAEPFADFAQTAALMGTLDLVVSVDTSVAHLAGALGKPVCTLLPVIAEWRWGETGDTTPWYPTMRLYRQRKQGDWSHPIAALAHDIEGLARGRRVRLA